MKRRKRDAADDLIGAIMSAIRQYQATKDAPEAIRQMNLIAKEAEDDGVWRCPHEVQCAHRAACAIAVQLGRPVKVSA